MTRRLWADATGISGCRGGRRDSSGFDREQKVGPLPCEETETLSVDRLPAPCGIRRQAVGMHPDEAEAGLIDEAVQSRRFGKGGGQCHALDESSWVVARVPVEQWLPMADRVEHGE